MRGGVHCLLSSAYRRHSTRRIRGVYPYALVLNAERYPSDTDACQRTDLPAPLMKSEGTYTGAAVGGGKTPATYVGGAPGGKSLVVVH